MNYKKAVKQLSILLLKALNKSHVATMPPSELFCEDRVRVQVESDRKDLYVR